MSLKIKSIGALHDYMNGVIDRADHHAWTVNAICSALIGFVITYADDIEVITREGNTGNVLWMVIKNRRYAFSYDHSKGIIELRSGSLQGRVVTTLDNKTPITEIQRLFNELAA